MKKKKIYLPVIAAAALALSFSTTAHDTQASVNTYQVNVPTGYLALRNAANADDSNIFGQLYTGDLVEVSDYAIATGYWYVYSPKYDAFGYVNNDYLNAINSSSGYYYDSQWTVSVNTGYLALRTDKAYNSSNEIGQLYTGDTVSVFNSSDPAYWYVYSPRLNQYGYVNKDYLTGGVVGAVGTVSLYAGETRVVNVATGYLALRNMKAYDSSNEIGQLYTGDTVNVFNSSDPAYWYVYSPRLNQYGYVNKDYLTGGVVGAVGTVSLYVGETRVVNVATGYLALRNMKAYDSSNEIGQLYTGDTVQILDTSDAQYWYVYSPKYDLNGFVNKDYLSGTASYSSRTVRVSKGYLALRSSKAYTTANETGELYTGDTVEVMDTSDPTYWYVYAPKLNNYGYVNKDYLY